MDDNLILRALMGAAGASVLAEIDLEKKRQEVEDLRTQLANAQQELSQQSMVANVETQQDAAAWQQQVDSANAEVSYLRARLDEERSVSAGLRKELADAQRAVSDAFAEVNSVRQQLDAANAAVSLQRAGIERLQAFVNLSRRLLGGTVRYADVNRLRAALAELDAGTIQPTPVAEPVPQSELSEEMQDAVPPSWAPLIADLRQRLAAAQAALTRERLDAEEQGHELERLQAFVGGIDNLLEQDRFDRRDIADLLIVLRSNSSATLTSSVVKESLTPTPVAEPLDAEGGA